MTSKQQGECHAGPMPAATGFVTNFVTNFTIAGSRRTNNGVAAKETLRTDAGGVQKDNTRMAGGAAGGPYRPACFLLDGWQHPRCAASQEAIMRTPGCDCCGTGTDACKLEVLTAAGWSLVEHEEGEQLLLLCPVCAWQRNRATEAVTAAVEAAHGGPPVRDAVGRRSKARRGWFWS